LYLKLLQEAEDQRLLVGDNLNHNHALLQKLQLLEEAGEEAHPEHRQ
jgi:hypothetical protein